MIGTGVHICFSDVGKVVPTVTVPMIKIIGTYISTAWAAIIITPLVTTVTRRRRQSTDCAVTSHGEDHESSDDNYGRIDSDADVCDSCNSYHGHRCTKYCNLLGHHQNVHHHVRHAGIYLLCCCESLWDSYCIGPTCDLFLDGSDSLFPSILIDLPPPSRPLDQPPLLKCPPRPPPRWNLPPMH